MKKLTVFGEAPYRGNRAAVHPGDRPLDAEAMQARAAADGLPASCFLWPGQGGDWQVRCYSPAGAIACCGHGMLAAVAVLTESSEAATVTLRQSEEGPALTGWREAQCHWLAFGRLPCETIAVPAWTRSTFSSTPGAAAHLGPADGYLLLVWEDEASLQALVVDPAGIGHHTRRAIIALAPAATPGFDYVLRYFAPQYGVDEGAVTGSAHRAAAGYLGRSQARGLQCSPGGGVVYTRLQADRVAIGGHVVSSR